MFENIRFVYHLWVPNNDILKNMIYRTHINCIKKYSHIFNDVTIVISYDDGIEKETISSIESDFIHMFDCSNIEFKLKKNNPLIREAETLYSEVFMKLNDYDGITFFGHSKGMQNIIGGTFNNEKVNNESIIEWICGMYFLNFEYFNDVKKTLIGDLRIVYGALLSKNTKMWGKLQWQYNGGFFWINTKKMYDHIKINNLYVPQCTDRTYAENALWKILPFDFNYIESHNTYYLDTDAYPHVNPYNNSDEFIRCVMPVDEEYDMFISFYSKIKEEI